MGYSIGFIGVDGVGKSTVIDEVMKIYDLHGDHQYMHRHLRPNLLPPLGDIKFIGKQKKLDGPVVPHSQPAGGKITSLVRLIWLLIDYSIGYYCVVYRFIRKKKRIVFFDRYLPEILIDPLRFRIAGYYFLRAMMFRFLPRPKYYIILYANPQIIISRKKELSVIEIERQQENFRKIFEKYPKTFFIEANKPASELAKIIYECIVRHERKD
ncbi:hypothetical protein N9A56_03510 [Planktomarina temperata]|nr:hypothetical protein [Planktomarina temperata]